MVGWSVAVDEVTVAVVDVIVVGNVDIDADRGHH